MKSSNSPPANSAGCFKMGAPGVEHFSQFARVLTHVGANLQRGEIAVIAAPPEACDLVRVLAEECWCAGARYVYVDYADDVLPFVRACCADENMLDDTPLWLQELRTRYGADNICFFNLAMPHAHDKFSGDTSRLLRARRAEEASFNGFYKATASGRVSIVKTVVPNQRWAEMLYSQMQKEQALRHLWKVFAFICRLDTPNPVEAWRAHQAKIKEKKAQLDALNICGLHIMNTHTDLSLDLVKGGNWIGGCAINQKHGLEFVPNIPTEEIFFVPDYRSVNGVVASTLPLNYKGDLIEGIALTVENGCVVKHSATHGEDLLRSILDTDEGSRRFGEVSLVSVQSPIYRTQTVFYDTLLDENAACHMALGNATPGILCNGYELSHHELREHGINRSSLHVDFMIGSEHCRITARLPDGGERLILDQGDWTI